MNVVFYITNIPFILMNTIDIEYYKFSQKRITYDFIDYLSLGEGKDTFRIIPQYMIEYWQIPLFFCIQIIILVIAHKNYYTIKNNTRKISILKQISLFLIACAMFIIGVRGGFQLKPIKPIDAGILSNTQNSILILNSPFCFLHTINQESVKEHLYFDEQKLDLIYNSTHHFKDNSFNKKNIVIIILESFSKEFIGYHNNGNGYTPFLDSLMENAMVMKNAYSNGIKSIEALPAITASLPTLMNDPFITSPYGANQYESIASILEEEGFSSSFFHGGSKGTMGFYQFSVKSKFSKYFGMEEYNNKDHFAT